MLLKQSRLLKIKSGDASLVFRKWKRPLVNKGSIIKTSVGQIEILDIMEVKKENITQDEAIQGAYKNLDDLINNLQKIKEGKTYKIELRYHSEDPRIKLREQSIITDEDYELLLKKLQRLDKYSKQGSWTLLFLNAIKNNPELRAEDLANKIGKEKMWLKIHVRKLKNLGLTISHKVGYTISPLGKSMLNRLET